ncbi:huntingtin-interacting protein K [Frankliniella occidentalis]|uniref:Huntingtin-interacting protein K n=1 Tax=Frankliniella occidentalis TaxID=133901 RepID=A0A6J1TKV2_FRAOC|nr:huntingtin-interacting protein K [Frankliniella occidentalis]
MASATNRVEEEVNGDSDELQQDSDKSQKRSAKHDSGASDLEKVTDFMEEKEIKHSEFLEGALSIIGAQRERDLAAKREREVELSKVSIKKDDVELIVREMEISRSLAERKLREHRGNVVEALQSLTD